MRILRVARDFSFGCEHCDECGGAKTYENVVKVKLADGKTVGVDHCIGSLVQALNDGGVPTHASCCGHGAQKGSITLADGRELTIEMGSWKRRPPYLPQSPG